METIRQLTAGTLADVETALAALQAAPASGHDGGRVRILSEAEHRAAVEALRRALARLEGEREER